MRVLLILLVRAYQRFISPLLPRSCKYYPSCSQYAIDALRIYGPARGTVLAGWRLLRCNPLSDGGFDPVENQRLFHPRKTSCADDFVGQAGSSTSGAEGADSDRDQILNTSCSGQHERGCHAGWRQGAVL